MSRINLKIHDKLLKEAKKYLKDVKPVVDKELELPIAPVTLTQEHLFAWLEIFEEDRIKLDGCNFATVKR